MILRALGLLLIATTSAHAGASFDCQKARTRVEVAICGDPATANLDGEVAAAYKAVQQKLSGDPAALATLVSAQKEFVTTRNKSFGQPGYDLARHLSQRLGELKQGVASTPAMTAPDITSYFKLVPLSVFDTTTDGLETEEERQLLLQKGASENWIYKRLHATAANLRATHPTSEVTFSLLNLGQPVLQVHVQNEKAETITYWTNAADGKPLQQHHPRTALQAAAAAWHSAARAQGAAPNGLVNPLTSVPAEIVAHVDALEGCQHWGGEVSENMPKERAAQITKALRELKCDNRPSMETALKRKYAANPIATEMLDRAKKLLGE
jgi:uncharacterized protein